MTTNNHTRAQLIALKQRTTWQALSERLKIRMDELINIATGDQCATESQQALFSALWIEENRK